MSASDSYSNSDLAGGSIQVSAKSISVLCWTISLHFVSNGTSMVYTSPGFFELPAWSYDQ